jgi:hypothetical protein
MKVVRLSALGTGRLYPPGNTPGTHFCWRLSRPQGHSATGRIMSMKNSNDTIGKRNRDLPIGRARWPKSLARTLKIWRARFNPVWRQMVATSSTCYDVVAFTCITQRGKSASHFVAIFSLVVKLLKKCRVR